MLAVCDSSIILPILGENLTTEISGDTGGSFAASKVHGDVKESVLFGDNAAIRNDIYTCLARPFALFNYGDPEAAPVTDFDVDSIVDQAKIAQVSAAFATACEGLSRAGVDFDPGVLAAAMRVPGVPKQPAPVFAGKGSSSGGGFGGQDNQDGEKAKPKP
jgi:phage gp29-like protein